MVDLIDEFSDGKIQFAFVKVKDQNTALPKCVLVAWVGGNGSTFMMTTAYMFSVILLVW